MNAIGAGRPGGQASRPTATGPHNESEWQRGAGEGLGGGEEDGAGSLLHRVEELRVVMVFAYAILSKETLPRLHLRSRAGGGARHIELLDVT